MDHIDTHVIRQRVIIGVTGLCNRTIQIHAAVTARFIIFERMVTEGEIARIGINLVRCTFT
jgi:hypothetical protein